MEQNPSMDCIHSRFAFPAKCANSDGFLRIPKVKNSFWSALVCHWGGKVPACCLALSWDCRDCGGCLQALSPPWPCSWGCLINFKANFVPSPAFCSRNLLPISQGPVPGSSSAGMPHFNILNISSCLGVGVSLAWLAISCAFSYFWRKPLRIRWWELYLE